MAQDSGTGAHGMARVEHMFDQIHSLVLEKTNELKQDLIENSKLIKHLTGTIDEVRDEQRHLNERLVRLERRFQEQEDRDRRCNLVFFGIEKIGHETWESIEDEIKKFCYFYFKINIEEWDIVRSHRVNPNKSSSPIVVKFQHYKVKEMILKKAKLLKGTNYAIYEDFSLETRSERKLLLQYAAQQRREDERTRCILSYKTLKVDGVPYVVENGTVVKKIKNGSTQHEPAAGTSLQRGMKRSAQTNLSPQLLQQSSRPRTYNNTSERFDDNNLSTRRYSQSMDDTDPENQRVAEENETSALFLRKDKNGYGINE